ncbi:MAG: hypothetical protein AUG49_16725 [Catenulispora sp. 13_1_20CM_3_70_7]|nr:MAG: hypothetical protein AUG49_16725 [Catenulispora sp. 13_1_20CM_3_70_7]
MVATPWDLALFSTALPLPESRSTITSTVTPSLSIWSAMVWNWFLSPWAFWMSYFRPLALNAAASEGRSWLSQRTEDLLSGRITPMNGFLPLPPELEEPEEPEAVFEPVVPEELETDLPLLHALSAIPVAAVATRMRSICLFIRYPFWDGGRLGEGSPDSGGLRAVLTITKPAGCLLLTGTYSRRRGSGRGSGGSTLLQSITIRKREMAVSRPRAWVGSRSDTCT